MYFLRTLKNPAELKTLREVFGRGFFAISVSSSYERRKQVLTEDRQIPEEEATALLERDQGEDAGDGQQTREAFHLADAFVALTEHDDDNKHQLWRILDLLFGHPFCTPTPEEYAMFLAYAASLRSGDISRQVGAVVISRDGELIATGANDVPRRGGGLYGPPKEYLSWPPSQQARATSADQRDYMRGYDSNRKRRREIVEDLAERLGLERSVVEEKLSGSLLNEVTEYGRAVHAEMEALLCCARVGVSPKGGTLFTTTFPCHNCTKHVVAAGVQGVRYIEPYPKSLAEELHGDAVAVDPTSDDGRVRFEPFHGIGPRRFMDLFSLTLGAGREVSRKDDLEHWRMQGAAPRFSLVARSYLEREKLALDEIEDVLRTLHGGADVDP